MPWSFPQKSGGDLPPANSLDHQLYWIVSGSGAKGQVLDEVLGKGYYEFPLLLIRISGTRAPVVDPTPQEELELYEVGPDFYGYAIGLTLGVFQVNSVEKPVGDL